MVLALLLPTTAATNCITALATRCLLERCTPAGCDRCDRECGGSAGTIGRGWGAAGEGAAFGGTESCLLGVGTDHPNPKGFRISIRHWAQGATITWSFETPVKLNKLWGPVSSPADAPDASAASVLSFELNEAPQRQTRANGRTDQWGFVLAAPYNGKWQVDCKGVSAPPSPPDPPMPAALAAPLEYPVIEEEDGGEAPAEEESERRGKRGSGRAKARQRRQRRRRKRARTKDDKTK